MGPIEVRVPHHLEPAEVRRRLERGIERAQSDFGDRVSRIDTAWRSDNELDVRVEVMGMTITSDLTLEPEAIVVRLTLPGMARLFAGKIRAGIEDKLGGLLAAPA